MNAAQRRRLQRSRRAVQPPFVMPSSAKGYNPPSCLAMHVSQFAHQRFLDGGWSYEQYTAFQNMAYELFSPEVAS